MTTTDGLRDHLALEPAAQDTLFREARTANTFLDEEVTEEQMKDVYDLVKWAPTSFNQQPLRWVLVRSADARERLASHMYHDNATKTRKAPLSAILAADTGFHEHLPTQFPVFPQAKDMFADPDVREESARFNAALQVGYFILGVRAAGLAAGPMTGFDAAAVEKEFFPAGQHRALAVVSIGKPGPDAWWPRGPRLTYEQIATTV